MRRPVVLLLILLPACAADAPPSPAARPSASVPDEVGAIDRALLVGSWRCRPLDPVEGAPSVDQTTTFGADGKALNVALVDTAQLGVPARYRMNFSYRWAIEGERIAATEVQSKVEAVDGNPASGFFAGLTQMVIGSFGNAMKPGMADVLRLDRDRLVIKGADVAEAPVMSCSRA